MGSAAKRAGRGRGLPAALAVLAGLWLAAGACRSTADAGQWHTVVHVNDGDTVVIDGKNRQSVRYLGVDTPEIDHRRGSAEPFGIEAREINRQLVMQRRVRLEFDRERTDRYGRWLAYVYLEDGTFVNREILLRGLGFCLLKPPNDRHAQQLLNAQRSAMEAGRGLWRGWSETGGDYLGNRSSRLFHLPGCPNAKKMSASNRIRFKSRWDAFWDGYAPARGCIKNGAVP